MVKKILIIGAGPAGLACAVSILENNVNSDVTVVDKKLRVGENPRCAGGISFWMAEKVGVSIPESCIVSRIRRVRIYAPDGNYWELRGDRDYGCIVNRELFEQFMAERVERLGGKIELGHLVSSKDLEFWLSKYDYIVGADGFPSVVANWVEARQPSSYDVHHCFQKEVFWDSFPQDTIEIYFGNEVAPKGYLWLFSAGEKRIRAGLGVPLSERANLRELWDSFLQRQTYDYKEINTVSKLIPTALPRNTNAFLGGKVLLVGDAGLFCDPATGGGIMQGLASGKAAGRALAEGRPENYNGYISWLRKQNTGRYKLKKVLYSFSDQDLNDLIHVMRGFKPRSLSVGKELRRAIIHLLLRKPHLLKKFFKYLR